MDYQQALKECGLQLLSDRRETLSRQFFKKTTNSEDKLNHLLNERQYKYCTRNQKKFKQMRCCTDRFKNTFIPHALSNFQ